MRAGPVRRFCYVMLALIYWSAPNRRRGIENLSGRDDSPLSKPSQESKQEIRNLLRRDHTELPAGVDLPFVHDLSILHDVIIRVLGRGKTGMICQYSDASANFDLFHICCVV
jgi:hypothetical protein